MKKKGLPADFITAAVGAAREFEGVYDLMKLWAGESDPKERDEILADIKDMIDDVSQKEKGAGVVIRFNDLDAVAKNIRSFKDSLLEIVMKAGGLTKLAELTNIPQPSLSRFFNSASMPRRSTLLVIFKALKIDAIKIPSDWVR
ncbi:MAG: helix-turn-helix domain-containing protein [Elusimicrobia bacterium]|nr:helix-turn-helix domain-containing protein [Candidatus Obscuribacterium magneticum]